MQSKELTTTLMTFFSYPVSVNYQYISDTPTNFPAVTICKVQNSCQEIDFC
jgi:hypothetical protein